MNRPSVLKDAGVELGEFLMELAARHKLTDVEMSYLLSQELDHTIEFLLAAEPATWVKNAASDPAAPNVTTFDSAEQSANRVIAHAKEITERISPKPAPVARQVQP